VEASVARVEQVWTDAQQAGRASKQDALLHETRKKAKATRYAWDAVAPAFGERAAEAASAWEEVTDALGELQDAHTATARLLQIASTAEDQGEPLLTYGILIGRIADQGDQARVRGR